MRLPPVPPDSTPDQPRPGRLPPLHLLGGESGTARPRTGVGVPGLAAVGVDDDGLPGHAGRDLDRAFDILRGAAVDADRDDLVGVGGQGERLLQRLPGAGAVTRDGVRQPGGRPQSAHRPQQRLGLIGVRDRLEGQHIRPDEIQHLQAGPVEGLQLGHTQPVSAPVLGAVREHRAVRSDRGRHVERPPDAPPSRVHRRVDGQLHALGDEFGRPVVLDPALREALEGGLVAGGDRHVGARLVVREVRLGDRLGLVREQSRRPQLVAQVVPGRPELVGQTAVEDERPGGEGVGEEGSGVAGHVSTLVDTAAGPGPRPAVERNARNVECLRDFRGALALPACSTSRPRGPKRAKSSVTPPDRSARQRSPTTPRTVSPQASGSSQRATVRPSSRSSPAARTPPAAGPPPTTPPLELLAARGACLRIRARADLAAVRHPRAPAARPGRTGRRGRRVVA